MPMTLTFILVTVHLQDKNDRFKYQETNELLPQTRLLIYWAFRGNGHMSLEFSWLESKTRYTTGKIILTKVISYTVFTFTITLNHSNDHQLVSRGQQTSVLVH